MLTLRSWLGQATLALENAGVDSPRLDAQVLIGHLLGRDRAWILGNQDVQLQESLLEHASRLLKRRVDREPLAYITGRREFYGRWFQVGRGALVPRQETETVLEAALAWLRVDGRVLDFGSGTGCLLLSILMERRDTSGLGLDISTQALKWAVRNALALGVSVELIQSNGFASLNPDARPFDLIVANPPYIARGEAAQPEVVHYEPDLALFAEDGGMALYRLLADEAGFWLADAGRMVVEVGDHRWPEVGSLFEGRGWTILELKRDLHGLPRALTIRR